MTTDASKLIQLSSAGARRYSLRAETCIAGNTEFPVVELARVNDRVLQRFPISQRQNIDAVRRR